MSAVLLQTRLVASVILRSQQTGLLQLSAHRSAMVNHYSDTRTLCVESSHPGPVTT